MTEGIKASAEDGHGDCGEYQEREIGNGFFQRFPQANDQSDRAADHDQAGDQFAPNDVAFLHEAPNTSAKERRGFGGLGGGSGGRTGFFEEESCPTVDWGAAAAVSGFSPSLTRLPHSATRYTCSEATSRTSWQTSRNFSIWG